MLKKKYYILTFLVNKQRKICSYLKVVKIKNNDFGNLAESMREECRKNYMKCIIYDKKLEINFFCDYIHVINYR